jgi:hypothetical protein
MLLDSGEGLEDFRQLFMEMIKFSFHDEKIRFDALERYKQCFLQPGERMLFSKLEHQRFFDSVERLDRRYWDFSYYQLEEFLQFLLNLYSRSNEKSVEIAKTILCVEAELNRRVPVW